MKDYLKKEKLRLKEEKLKFQKAKKFAKKTKQRLKNYTLAFDLSGNLIIRISTPNQLHNLRISLRKQFKHYSDSLRLIWISERTGNVSYQLGNYPVQIWLSMGFEKLEKFLSLDKKNLKCGFKEITTTEIKYVCKKGE